MTHVKNTINITSECHQYAYRQNRSTADADSAVIHQAFTHLETSNSYVRLLFLDFSSAFNTIIPQTLIKLSAFGLAPPLSKWILDLLTHRPQSIRINNLTSSTTILNTGSTQGCVLSPLLYTLLTYDCRADYHSNVIVCSADDTAVISNGDETAYRQEVRGLERWCGENNLILNTKKMKELILDFRRKDPIPPPLYSDNAAVERVHTFKYLGMHLTNTLTWRENTVHTIKMAHQRLYFLRKLKGAGMSTAILESFYKCVVESISIMTSWVKIVKISLPISLCGIAAAQWQRSRHYSLFMLCKVTLGVLKGASKLNVSKYFFSCRSIKASVP